MNYNISIKAGISTSFQWNCAVCQTSHKAAMDQETLNGSNDDATEMYSLPTIHEYTDME